MYAIKCLQGTVTYAFGFFNPSFPEKYILSIEMFDELMFGTLFSVSHPIFQLQSSTALNPFCFFLAPSEAQGVTMSVCLTGKVCLDLH